MRETRSEVLTVLDGRGKSAPIGMCIVDRAPSGVRVEREAARGARRLSARIAARQSQTRSWPEADAEKRFRQAPSPCVLDQPVEGWLQRTSIAPLVGCNPQRMVQLALLTPRTRIRWRFPLLVFLDPPSSSASPTCAELSTTTMQRVIAPPTF